MYFPLTKKYKQSVIFYLYYEFYCDGMKLRNCRPNLLGNDSPGRVGEDKERGMVEGCSGLSELDSGYKLGRRREREERTTSTDCRGGACMHGFSYLFRFKVCS